MELKDKPKVKTRTLQIRHGNFFEIMSKLGTTLMSFVGWEVLIEITPYRKNGEFVSTNEDTEKKKDSINTSYTRDSIIGPLAQRYLDVSERAELALRYKSILSRKAKQRQREHGNTCPGRKKNNIKEDKPIQCQKEAAEAFRIAEGTLYKYEHNRRSDSGELSAYCGELF